MVGFGSGLMVTRYGEVVVLHPVAVNVAVRCTEPDPLAPHVTLIELPVDEPTITPPETDHDQVTPKVVVE